MKLEQLKIIAEFMQRVPMTGSEALAWCSAMAAVKEDIDALTSIPAAPSSNEPPKTND